MEAFIKEDDEKPAPGVIVVVVNVVVVVIIVNAIADNKLGVLTEGINDVGILDVPLLKLEEELELPVWLIVDERLGTAEDIEPVEIVLVTLLLEE